MLTKHIKLKKLKNSSTWRKVAINSWKRPTDPTTFGLLKLEATKFKQFIINNPSISTTHLFTKVVGNALAEFPEVNGMVRGSNIYLRDSIDIFLQVAVDKAGNELSGTVIRNVDKKNVFEIKKDLQHAALAIRNNSDPNFKKVKRSISLIPSILTRPILKILDFILYYLNIHSSLLGVQKDPFGSCMITSVSSFGVEHGFIPFPAVARVPLLLALFDLKDEVQVIDGEIKIVPILTVSVTLDHRVIDGVYGGKIISSVKKHMQML